MSAAVPLTGVGWPQHPTRPRRTSGPLFAGLLVSARPRRRAERAVVVSGLAHVLVAVVLVLAPLLTPVPPPRRPDYIRAILYDPPPPPPLPLPRGSPLVAERPRPKVEASQRPAELHRLIPVLEAPIQTAAPAAEPDPEPPETHGEAYGSPAGSDSGVPEGMEGGVEGGMVGGVPGGVLGGVIGGTGEGPVSDFDRPPRVLRQTKPRYPQEAFVKRVEGTVLVEFVIDAGGRVVTARVIQSIPLLDAAALEAVREWIFAPAFKHGQPVATAARAPVVFRIY